MFLHKYSKAVRVAQLGLSTVCILGLIPNVAMWNGYGCQVGQGCPPPSLCYISGFPLPIQTKQFCRRWEHTDRGHQCKLCATMWLLQQVWIPEYIQKSKKEKKKKGKTCSIFFSTSGSSPVWLCTCVTEQNFTALHFVHVCIDLIYEQKMWRFQESSSVNKTKYNFFVGHCGTPSCLDKSGAITLNFGCYS